MQNRRRVAVAFSCIIPFLVSCSSSPESQDLAPAPKLPNPYADHMNSLTPELKPKIQKNIEDFYVGMRDSVMTPRILKQEATSPILMILKTDENSTWFLNFFETLVGLQLMAKSNSFRGYQNSECYDAYVKTLGLTPLPPASALLSLDELMRAGNRIPDQNTYMGQVGLFCGRLAINKLQGIEPAKIAKIHLTLKHNLVLKKHLLKQASDEANLIATAYGQSLAD